MVRLAINGFGRIGRVAFRAALTLYREQLKLVAINTSGSMPTAGWGHLAKYDSVYGKFERGLEWNENDLIVEEERIPVLAQNVPTKIPWNRFGVDVVIESTGIFRTKQEASQHLDAGAKRVIISANPKTEEVPIFINKINLDKYNQEKVISCGSCPTNSAIPVCWTILKNFAVENGRLITVHAATSDQRLLDNSHKDLRRARTAFNNIIPTTSGVAEAVVQVLPQLKGKFTGMAVRVPVACGSWAGIIFNLKRRTTVAQVRKVLAEAAAGRLKETMAYSEEPLVSSDIVGNPKSAIIDSELVDLVDGRLLQIGAWYDNEWAYCCRMLEAAIEIGRHVV